MGASFFLFEYKINGKDEEDGRYEVIPSELQVEGDDGEDDEDNECENLLDDFELHEVERTAVAVETNLIGRHLEAIFEKGDAPTDGNDGDEGKVLKPFHFAELEVTIPCENHEDVGTKEESDG